MLQVSASRRFVFGQVALPPPLSNPLSFRVPVAGGPLAGRAMIMRGRRLRTPAIPAIATAIKLASGWRRRFIAFAAGATGALAMAPINFFPALIIPMTVAVWLIDGEALGAGRISYSRPAAARRAFVDGWWWGFGYFAACFWWLGAAFLVEADEFAWAMPLGVFGLPAVLAVFPGFGFMLAQLIWTPGVGRLFALAAALSFTEWLRGHVLTGFPWNTLGMALGGNLVTANWPRSLAFMD